MRWQRLSDSERRNTLKARDQVVNTVFPALRKKGIIARANFLCCSSCASYDLATQATAKNKRGWVFWHRQDEQRVMEDGGLYLKFTGSDGCSKPPKNAVSTITIANEVIQELRNAGITYDWDGSTGTCIYLDLKAGLPVPVVPTIKSEMESIIGL